MNTNTYDARYDPELTYEERAAARRYHRRTIVENTVLHKKQTLAELLSRKVQPEQTKFMRGEKCERCGHLFAHRSKSKEAHYASKNCREGKPYSDTEIGKRQKKGEDRALKMRKKMNEKSRQTLHILQKNLDLWRSRQNGKYDENKNFKKITRFIVYWLNNPSEVKQLEKQHGAADGNLCWIVKTLETYRVLSKH